MLQLSVAGANTITSGFGIGRSGVLVPSVSSLSYVITPHTEVSRDSASDSEANRVFRNAIDAIEFQKRTPIMDCRASHQVLERELHRLEQGRSRLTSRHGRRDEVAITRVTDTSKSRRLPAANNLLFHFSVLTSLIYDFRTVFSLGRSDVYASNGLLLAQSLGIDFGYLRESDSELLERLSAGQYNFLSSGPKPASWEIEQEAREEDGRFRVAVRTHDKQAVVRDEKNRISPSLSYERLREILGDDNGYLDLFSPHPTRIVIPAELLPFLEGLVVPTI